MTFVPSPALLDTEGFNLVGLESLGQAEDIQLSTLKLCDFGHVPVLFALGGGDFS